MIVVKQAFIAGPYRYSLSRIMGPGLRALWIGVNPSTADASIDDASIRRLYGFAEILGIGQWDVGNLFAYRATDVRELAKVDDPIGPLNDQILIDMIQEADLVIAGWGRIDKVPRPLRYRVREIKQMAEDAEKKLMCWGICDDGSPVHPLFIPYSRILQEWDA